MCTFIPYAYAVSSTAPFYLERLLLEVLLGIGVLAVLVWPDRPHQARWFARIGLLVISLASVFAIATMHMRTTPYLIVFAVFVVLGVIRLGSVAQQGSRAIAFGGVVFVVGMLLFWATPLGMDCGPGWHDSVMVREVHSWNDLDDSLDDLERGEIAVFAALDPLACESCPEGGEGRYIAYRCDEIVIRSIPYSLESMLDDPEAPFEVRFDRNTSELFVEDSCPLTHTRFGS